MTKRSRREWVETLLAAVVLAGYWMAAAGAAGAAGLRAGEQVREPEVRDERA